MKAKMQASLHYMYQGLSRASHGTLNDDKSLISKIGDAIISFVQARRGR